jgi:hypothetical protein
VLDAALGAVVVIAGWLVALVLVRHPRRRRASADAREQSVPEQPRRRRAAPAARPQDLRGVPEPCAS